MTTTNNIDIDNEIKQYNNVTLKSLTASQLLSQRENICELFQLIDDTAIHGMIVNEKRQTSTLNGLKSQLEILKKD
ncbi:hypothetical protein TPHA_0O00910 [Tetrapisispora phaffii CBS 4417]|uniref:Uncharacterized protein n=1 Tax=Tetrapisispora phaffii (strain ATCC 24235 / CBS 4417 / NBRC 1672 / NRRL Y-8282 / UCD 70-5) TaxID=1071381 RepID=G8C1N2_TETPH|nr:hypothetical protein TPHA_0O00910 [Tetrapisispora phaffii CBS 4417]CCE66060.1 hypothetical protein TPHA_0O00910 [Tetrapisispora phaffii CBS 4417]